MISASHEHSLPASERATTVVCRGLVKTYGSGDSAVTALRGVDLNVYGGEIHMLVGPSGCGKTTLISVIAGILDQTAGQCIVLGQDFSRMSNTAKTTARGSMLGFVFQAFNLLPTLTAEQNVAIPLMLNGASRHHALAVAGELLDQVGLGNRLQSLPAQMSGGQQQRVAIARSMIHNPRLIVCDEPTSALDHRTGHQVMELLRGLAADGNRSIVIVTHDSRIFEFADRISRMDDGRIIESGANRNRSLEARNVN
jgi:putative ABC transport system ATP-binding protein